MTPPKISIIVPIYNVKPWLAQCLDSILNQSLQSWEAILVDDGSTDGSGPMIDLYAERDHRFKTIHKENGGLGSARNAGCAAAKGDYLFFLDSDDLLTRDILQSLHTIAVRDDADIILGDFYTFWENTDKTEIIDINRTYPARDNFISTFAAYPNPLVWQNIRHDLDLLYHGIYFCVVCGKLFRTALWKSLDCKAPNDLRMAEDFIAVKKITFSAKKISIFPSASYIYRKRAGSATTQRSTKSFEVFRAYDYALKMFKDIGVYDQEYSSIHLFFLRMLMSHMLYFTPFHMWWSFYKKTAAITRTWDEKKLHAPFDYRCYAKLREENKWYFIILMVTQIIKPLADKLPVHSAKVYVKRMIRGG